MDNAPYQRHSRTSRNAAGDITPSATTLRAKVMEFIISCGIDGATDDEMQVCLDMNPSTQRPRRIDLWHAGLVFDTGRTRQTRSNRKATVWAAAEFKPRKAPDEISL